LVDRFAIAASRSKPFFTRKDRSDCIQQEILDAPPGEITRVFLGDVRGHAYF
jgi:hypothetical protein